MSLIINKYELLENIDFSGNIKYTIISDRVNKCLIWGTYCSISNEKNIKVTSITILLKQFNIQN